MNSNRVVRMAVMAGCLLTGSVALPAAACDDGKLRQAGVSPALTQAIDRLRAEQRVQVRQAAQTALAQLRSEARTALAQGATTSATAAVHAAP